MFELPADENEAQSSPTIHLTAATGKRGEKLGAWGDVPKGWIVRPGAYIQASG
jgi:hypothetical protein